MAMDSSSVVLQLVSYEQLLRFQKYVPCVPEPFRNEGFKSRLFTTLLCVMIYLVLCQLPLYGMMVADGPVDPLYNQRLLTGSCRGTVMELGMQPLLTSGFLLHMITQAKSKKAQTQGIMNNNNNNNNNNDLMRQRQRKEVFEQQQLSKLLAYLLATVMACTYVAGGMFGDLATLGQGNCVLIVLQLVGATVVVSLLDETVTRGHGVGESGAMSGISLFMATNVCADVVWALLSPVRHTDSSGQRQFFGILPHVMSRFFAFTGGTDISLAHKHRPDTYPSFSSVLGTVGMVCIAVYVQALTCNVPLTSTTNRKISSSLKVPLLYTQTTPAVLYASITGNFLMSSRFLYVYKFSPKSAFAHMFGMWERAGKGAPTGGLAYVLCQARSITSLFSSFTSTPILALVRIMLPVGGMAYLSWQYSSLAGSDAVAVANQLHISQLTVRNRAKKNCPPHALSKEIDSYIFPACIIGGALLGLITVLADAVGVIGGGVGVMMTCSTLGTLLDVLENIPEWTGRPARKFQGND